MTAMAEQVWVAVCGTESVLRSGGVAALLDGGEQVAVFRTEDGEFLAVSNIDPCSGAAVLSRGIVGESGGAAFVASPIYKQRFDLRSGVCLDEENVRVRTYPVRVIDGVVHVGSP